MFLQRGGLLRMSILRCWLQKLTPSIKLMSVSGFEASSHAAGWSWSHRCRPKAAALQGSTPLSCTPSAWALALEKRLYIYSGR